MFIHVNGQIRSRSIGDKRAAEAVASQLRRKLRAGEFALGPRTKAPEFVAYARHYLETFAKITCKPTTVYGYRVIIEKHLAPLWKGKRLDQITRADLKRLLLQKQQEGFAPATVENIKALVSGIFTHAYEEDILTSNPALKMGRYIQKQDHRQHVQPLTRGQASHFLQIAQQDFPSHYPLLLCAFRTGMRMGELLGLAWSDVDFAGNVMTVRRSYTHGLFSTPKSHKSRMVDMSNQLKTTLLEHCQRLRERFGGRLPTWQAPGPRSRVEAIELVFPSECGGPLDADNFRRRVFYPLLEKADVPRFRFHDIRHTFASLLLANGESLHYVKEQMGHASIQTTVDVYGHLVPGSNRNAVNRLDDPEEPALRAVSVDAG